MDTASDPWSLSREEAVALQKELAGQVRLQDDPGVIKTVAGVDVSMSPHATEGFAAIVVLAWPSLEVVEVGRAKGLLRMPYITGLLSFREIPLLLQAWEGLSILPDLVLFDGQGIAHPRRLGIASHAGLLLDRPTIGVAKTILV